MAGDTIASALYRAGRRVFSRSFKYHRPRGLLCGAGVCPNCMMNVDGVPNVRACTVQPREGMVVRAQNAWPSIDFDVLALAENFKGLMPVGWYYKSFTSRASWKMVEPFIRRIAGLGEPPATDTASRQYEHSHLKCETVVIGGGASGIRFALERAAQGERVLLVEKEEQRGGRMRYRNGGAERQDLVAAVERNSNIEVLTGASCFGIYEDNLVAIVQRDPCAGVAERLIHVRARLAAVATGVYEAPLLFENNDLPGIMLSTGVQRLIRLHGIKPGDRAVIVGTAERAAELQADLKSAGVTVAATVPLYQVLSAKGSGQVTGILTRNGSHACDLIVVCGYLMPDAGLLHQADGSLQWDKEANAFVPSEVPDHVIAIGGVTGRAPGISNAAPPAAGATPPSSFVCLCADATAGDISGAVSEGFDEIELVKRYTTATMGPCQGKMCQITSIGLCASATGRSMGQTGVTTSRPPNPSVSLDALAGPRHHPARHTPMHHGHDALGAVWLDMGDWKRPRFYRTAESADESLCVRGEYKAVREHAGIIDVSTLGKLDVKGRDVGKLLDKVYTGRLSDMKPGRTRYGVICDEAGVMLDDGTVSRLDDEHYFITTTTGNLDFVEQWLLWWTAGTDWDVHVTNMTPGLAAINLAGPAARDVLRKLTSCDLESKAFPYMACRAADVAGVPAWLFRIGFVGETGWEIHFPADYGHHVWQALLEAGKDVDIRAFGVEAQRLLRLEKRHVIIGVDTDALTSPFASQMGWVAKLDKPDFVGRISLLAAAAEDPRDILTGFVMQDDVVPEDGAPVVIGGKPVGRVTSARFSPAREAGIGLAWVPRGSAADGSPIFIRVQGRLVKAQVVQSAFYDPEGVRLRQ